MPLPVQARDGLLADVAALGEAHRAVVEPGLLGDDRVVELDAVARAPASTRTTSAAASGRHGARRASAARTRVGVRRRRRDVDAGVRARPAGRGAADLAARRVLRDRQRLRRRRRSGVRADERQQAALERALVQLDVPADRAAARAGRTGPAARRARCPASSSSPRVAARGGRPASCPCGSAARRSSRCPGRAPRRRWRPGRRGTPARRAPVSGEAARGGCGSTIETGACHRILESTRPTPDFSLRLNFEFDAAGHSAVEDYAKAIYALEQRERRRGLHQRAGRAPGRDGRLGVGHGQAARRPGSSATCPTAASS